MSALPTAAQPSDVPSGERSAVGYNHTVAGVGNPRRGFIAVPQLCIALTEVLPSSSGLVSMNVKHGNAP
jgi:hypothetical protein